MYRRLLLFAVCAAALAAFTAPPAVAEVDVHVNIGVPLPEVVIEAPPALVVIPGTYIYVAPDIDADIVFYQDYWYRPYRGVWYISTGYNGPWRAVRRAPPAVLNLPPNYRRSVYNHERVPYGHVKQNWRNWERDRYWERRHAERPRHMERPDRGPAPIVNAPERDRRHYDRGPAPVVNAPERSHRQYAVDPESGRGKGHAKGQDKEKGKEKRGKGKGRDKNEDD